MQNARPFVTLKIALNQATSHLHTHTQHGLGHFDMLALQERFCVLGEIQGHQRTLVLGTAQLNPAIRQLDNF